MMHAELLTAKLTRGIFKGNSSERFKVVIKRISACTQFRSFFSMSTKLKTTENETKKNGRTMTSDSLLSAADSPLSRRITRNAHYDAVLSDKEKFLDMTREEKRKLYKCGKKFKQPSDIQTWPDFYREHKERLKKAVAKKRLPMRYKVNEDINQKVSIWKGDITTLEIDAIANAANGSLLGGGGVDGAIHSAAGKKLVAECGTLDGCDTGDAKITAGYKLPAKYVIHTVGPIGEKKDLLAKAYSSILSRLKENNLASLAIPCISTGIYGYPSEKAVHVALQTVRDFLEYDEYGQNIDRVIFCLFMPKDVAIYEEQMQAYFPLAACTDAKNDIEMENLEENKVDKKKTDKKGHGNDEKMDTGGKEEEHKYEEEKMETEGKETEEDKGDTQLIKDTKDKTQSSKEEKMDTSEDNKNDTVDKVDSDVSRDKKDRLETRKQTTASESIKTSKIGKKSDDEKPPTSKEKSKDEDCPLSGSLTRKNLRDLDTSDSHPQVKKQAKK